MRFAKITPEETGAQPWVIADDELGRGPNSRWLVSGAPGFSQQVQPGVYLEAPFQEPIARDNRAMEITLVVDCGFANEDDCLLFVAQLPMKCPGSGRLDIGIVNGARISYDAVVASVTPTDVAATAVTLTYRLLLKPTS